MLATLCGGSHDGLKVLCDWILENGPNHTFIFDYIYHCHMISNAYYNTACNLMLKLLKVLKKFSENKYA